MDQLVNHHDTTQKRLNGYNYLMNESHYFQSIQTIFHLFIYCPYRHKALIVLSNLRRARFKVILSTKPVLVFHEFQISCHRQKKQTNLAYNSRTSIIRWERVKNKQLHVRNGVEYIYEIHKYIILSHEQQG